MSTLWHSLFLHKKAMIIRTETELGAISRISSIVATTLQRMKEYAKPGMTTKELDEFGGMILPIEVTYYKGKNDLILTGSLGDVIKESAQIALSYIKTHYKEFNIDYKTLESSDIHVHVPEGAVQKDGPSAGITLTSSIISAFSNMPIDKNIAMTGEMTLRGNILPVGGLKEKVIGAHRSNIKTILIPKKNESDLDDIPEDIKKDITFILVEDYKDVYEAIKVK